MTETVALSGRTYAARSSDIGVTFRGGGSMRRFRSACKVRAFGPRLKHLIAMVVPSHGARVAAEEAVRLAAAKR